MHSLRKQKIALFGLVMLFFNVVGLYSIPLSLTYVVSAQAPIVSVKSQPDAPILVRLERIVSDNPYAPAFEYSVANVSDRPVRAYAIRFDDGWGVTMSYPKSAFQPGRSQPGTYGDVTSSIPTKGIMIAVDFVEFIDGTTWGADTNGSIDRLAGMRAGRSEERDRLLKLLEEGGTQAVINSIDPGDAQVVPPPNHSKRWELGFRASARHFRASLQSTYREKGVAAMEAWLRQPLETSEEK